MAFSPDGQVILIGDEGGVARRWDAVEGRPLGLPLKKHNDSIVAVHFSPDGKLLLTGSRDGTTQMWDSATGKPLGPPLAYGVPAAYLSDGKTIATGGSADGIIRFSKVPSPVQGKVERVILWSQVITGMELEPSGGGRELDEVTWHQRLRRLKELGGPPIE
jgi:WD40 repeat protein